MSDLEFEPCDECGLRSYVWVNLASGKILSYCGHHYRDHEDALGRLGVYILDMRHMVLA